MEALDSVVRLTIGGIALWAAAAKLGSFPAWVNAVGRYALVPRTAAPLVAMAIVSAELVIGLASLPFAPVGLRQLAAAGAVPLFAVFTVGIFALVHRGSEAPCECFGVSDAEPVSGATLTRAAALLALSLWVAFRYPSPMPSSATDLVLVILGAVGLIFVLRGFTVVPQVWGSLRAPLITTPAPTRRLSFRYAPPDASLFESGTPMAKKSALTVLPD